MTQAISSFSTGTRALQRGYRMIFRKGLRRYTLLPIIINVVLFIIGIGWAGHSFDDLLARMIPDGWDWLAWLLWPLFALIVLLVSAYTFTFLANLIGSPFNAQLARAVVRLETGQSPPSSNLGLVGGLSAAVTGELRKWAYFLVLALAVFLISLLPVINVAAVLLWPLLSCWIMALEYGDYPMGEYDKGFTDQRAWWRGHRSLALGFGGATALFSLIPIINLVVMPAAVCGATLLWLEQEQAKA